MNTATQLADESPASRAYAGPCAASTSFVPALTRSGHSVGKLLGSPGPVLMLA